MTIGSVNDQFTRGLLELARATVPTIVRRTPGAATSIPINTNSMHVIKNQEGLKLKKRYPAPTNINNKGIKNSKMSMVWFGMWK